MSSLKVNQIRGKLLSMFAPYLNLSDISEHDSDKESKILSRCLAALAVYLKAGCSEREAAESVWDGADDNGLDAVFFDASDTRLIFVQSKWIHKGTGEPEAKDVMTFVKGVRDAVEQDLTGFHSRLHGKFNDMAVRIATPGTSVELTVVTTGASELAKHSAKILDDFLAELNGDDPEAIAFKSTLGLAEVYSGLANDPLVSNVTVDATLLDWSFVPMPYPAYFGMIDGLSIKSWWKKHGKGLVAANIRHSLGSTEVNNEIRHTATSVPQKFWYFNNGITLVANEAVKAPAGVSSRSAGVFSFKGASIVNGAQTVSSIARVDDDSSLALVRVPVRVILLKDAPEGFGSEVTRTNNLQNRVEPRDFVAQDPEQKRLRQEMAVEGIDYQFVRSEELTPTPTSCELLEVTTALACASGDPNLAVQIKTGISRFYADLKKPPYRAIFNPTVSGAKAFNAALLLRAIESWIDRKKKTVAKKSGTGWGVLIHGNRILAAAVFKNFGLSSLSQPIGTFQQALTAKNLDNICESVHQKMVGDIAAHYSNRVLAVLFKNPSMSKHLYDGATA